MADTGWHMVMGLDGQIVRLGRRYDAMTESEKADANRFARVYPNGQG